jgi:hypothetical protein
MAVVFGVEMPDLPEGAVPLDVVCLVKALDAEGRMMLCERSSDGLTRWEALGMATTFADSMRARLIDSLRDGDDGDDG